MRTKVISAFPACGKSFAVENFSDRYTMLDSDSSSFSWLSEGVRNPNFPLNYIKHIKENIGKVDFIFVSSHKEVRNLLHEHKIDFILVYPLKSQLNEYIKRCENRGSDEKFINFIKNNWYDFIKELDNEDVDIKIQLSENCFISDLFDLEGVLE